MTDNDQNLIEEIIGYTFKDKSLISAAFTHPSFSSTVGENNQRLEFLGDSVLNMIVAEYVYKNYPSADEGKLTKLRANCASTKPLSEAIDRIRLSEYVAVGKQGKSDSVKKLTSTKEDLFESLCGAIYLDGGLDCARNLVCNLLEKALSSADELSVLADAKSVLNEYAEKHGLTVEYTEINKEGPPHKPVFTYTVSIDGEVLGQGRGTKATAAQQSAAFAALEKLKKKK